MDPLILLIEPELDERSATATMSRAQRIYEQGARDISRVMREQLTEGAQQGGRAVEDMADKARRAYLSMQDASEKVAREERKLDTAREKGASNTEAIARRVERARLDEIQAINRARDAYVEYGQAARDAGQAGEHAGTSILGGLRGAVAGAGQSGGDMANEFAAGFAGSSALMRLGAAGGPIGLGLAGVAALGYASGKILADNLSAGMDTLRMQDQFRAKMGLDPDTMRRYGAAASNAWTSGFGQSTQDNLASLQFGVQSGLVDRNASNADLRDFASQMDTMKQLVDADAREIAAGTRNFVKTGLVDSYGEAFDLITAGQQKGLNISNDLLDTAEEYGTALHGVGLNGVEAFGLIAQMQAAGIRNTDVAADSLKELAINASDGSKLTSQAFTAMGLDAAQLNAKFAEGGPAARQAFGEVLDGLRNIDDPIQRQNIGLALYKTKWEDAKTAIGAANLNTAAAQMGDVEGRTKAASDALSANADQWDLLGRNIDNTISKLQTGLAKTGPGSFVMNDLPKFFSDNLFSDPQAMAQAALDAAQRKAREQNERAATAPAIPGRGMHWEDGRGWVTGDARPTDRVAAVPMPNPAAGGGSTSLPDAPVVPLQYTNTAGMPSAIANATNRLDEARHDVAEKEARLNQLRQSNLASEQDRLKAENDVTKARQSEFQAEQSLNDARINAAQQAQKQLGKLSSDLDDFGNKLDADFGISKGLGGIVENFVKAAGNILAAPFLQALGLIAKANPNEGSGLIGIAAANGAFGSQYTPAAIAATQNPGAYGIGRAPGATSYVGGPYPGDAALLAGIPAGKYAQTQAADLTQGLGDCSSAVEDLVNILDGRPTEGRSMATGNATEWLMGHGFLPGMGNPGDFRVGFNSGHMQATLPGGTNFNWGSDAAAANRGIGGSGAWDPAFTSHFYRPVGSPTISTPGASGADIYAPANTSPSLTSPGVAPPPAALPGVPGMAGGLPGTGMPQAAPFGGPSGISPSSFGNPFAGQQGPGVAPGISYPSQGGNTGNIAGGLPLDAAMGAASALDALAPGAGAAAKIGIQLANRTAGYVAQDAGILASGALETLSVGDNPKGSLGAGWLGKVIGGLAGAAPALPNIAGGGGKKPPGPMEQAGGGQTQTNNVDNSQTHITLQPPKGVSAETQASMVAEQTRMYAPPGRQ
ncbi:phage tail tape measure protein [Mycolicibacterium sp. J2]|uniref:phage tail tape measure protein n=1 Tax=Mycolicibacterium sp. J2 TaxID=2993511 RepID=UPI00224A700F|nr:phage tail tape measure protein [Mycolicibacterium sp. J2]MCX2712044.1 phage tail tape measure protein [Mycolicibacterium sp. J2]